MAKNGGLGAPRRSKRSSQGSHYFAGRRTSDAPTLFDVKEKVRLPLGKQVVFIRKASPASWWSQYSANLIPISQELWSSPTIAEDDHEQLITGTIDCNYNENTANRANSSHSNAYTLHSSHHSNSQIN